MKTTLSLPAATQLLAIEFARQKSPDCRACSVPMLFWGPAPAGLKGLWYLNALTPCVHGCHSLVARIWVDITTRHDIEHLPTYSPPRRHSRALKVPSPQA